MMVIISVSKIHFFTHDGYNKSANCGKKPAEALFGH